MRLIVILFTLLYGANLHFNLYKKGEGNNTLLVIGGIHGNEPGGYYAASFLVRYYKINKGSLWIVPNLNFDSIVEFKRGKYGDMNRKFAFIAKNDKDYEIVSDIKKIMLLDNVKMIINLHDGHGFYRESWKNSIFNPAAWGQTCIIDQENIKAKFGNLGEIAKKVAKRLNEKLTKDYHIFNVKNTKTKFKDEQMRLSLTYFAITHNKAAFAIETSKNIKDLATKIFYQLRAIEEFMKIVGIEYKREFNLTISAIKEILKRNEYVKIGNTILPLKNLRAYINYFPFPKNPKVKTSNPLVTLLKKGKVYQLKEAFYTRSTLIPYNIKGNCKVKSIIVEVDGKKEEITIPSVVKVKKYFSVITKKRINVIGFNSKTNEANVKIKKDMLLKRFSVDKDGKIYRVEIYNNRDFCGMFLVEFE